jgi:hypothetical protein
VCRGTVEPQRYEITGECRLLLIRDLCDLDRTMIMTIVGYDQSFDKAEQMTQLKPESKTTLQTPTKEEQG